MNFSVFVVRRGVRYYIVDCVLMWWVNDGHIKQLLEIYFDDWRL